MKLVDNGALVVYGEGDQYFDDLWAALRFAAHMECMGYDCLFYIAEIVGGLVSVLGRLSAARTAAPGDHREDTGAAVTENEGGLAK